MSAQNADKTHVPTVDDAYRAADAMVEALGLHYGMIELKVVNGKVVDLFYGHRVRRGEGGAPAIA